MQQQSLVNIEIKAFRDNKPRPLNDGIEHVRSFLSKKK